MWVGFIYVAILCIVFKITKAVTYNTERIVAQTFWCYEKKREMVHHLMIGLDPGTLNVSKFKQWGELHNKSCEFLPGVRVSSLDDIKDRLTPYGYYIMHSWRETSSHFDSVGPAGCFLAHRNAWKVCCERNEMVWVLEEGVVSYETDLFTYLDDECGDFDLILGHTVPVMRMWKQRSIPTQATDPEKPLLAPIDKIYYGAKCYRVSPGFARQLLLLSDRFDVHVDTYIPTMAIYHGPVFKCARTTQKLVRAGSSYRNQHTVDHGLLILCLLVLVVIISALVICVIGNMYRRCRQTNLTT